MKITWETRHVVYLLTLMPKIVIYGNRVNGYIYQSLKMDEY